MNSPLGNWFLDMIERNKQPPRAFTKEQLEHIAAREKECDDAGCDDNGHKHE